MRLQLAIDKHGVVPTHSYGTRWLVGLVLLTYWDHGRPIFIECHGFSNYLRDSVIIGLVGVLLHGEWYCARLAESGGGGRDIRIELDFQAVLLQASKLRLPQVRELLAVMWT